MKNLLLAASVFLVLSSCSRQDTSSEADDTSNADLATSTAEIGDAAGAGSTGVGRENDDVLRPRAACTTVAFGACTTEKRERNFSSPSDGYCTRGPANYIRTYGKVVLTFANAATCDFAGTAGSTATPPSVTRTLENHYMQRGALGRKLLIYTGTGQVSTNTISDADLKDFEGNTRSGGAVVKKLDGNVVKLTINGIHRRGLTIGGKYTLWHTLYSDADGLTITDGGGGDRLVSGTMYVMHNRLSRKITKTLTAVKFTSACRFPIAGTTDFAWTGGSFSVTWGACGTATIDGTSVTLDTEAAG